MNIVIDEVSNDHVSNDHVSNDLICDDLFTIDQDQTAKELHYKINFTLPMLRHIAGFYDINHKRINKQDLIEAIVMYEGNPDNILMTQERERLWYYIDEIKANKYLSKFLISM